MNKPITDTSKLCDARAIFWPDDECCEAECMKEEGHTGPHEDDILGEFDNE